MSKNHLQGIFLVQLGRQGCKIVNQRQQQEVDDLNRSWLQHVCFGLKD